MEAEKRLENNDRRTDKRNENRKRNECKRDEEEVSPGGDTKVEKGATKVRKNNETSRKVVR